MLESAVASLPTIHDFHPAVFAPPCRAVIAVNGTTFTKAMYHKALRINGELCDKIVTHTPGTPF
jgi:hypothetical protein